MEAWHLITLLGEPVPWMIFSGVLLVSYFFFRKRISDEKRVFLKRFSVVFIISVWLTLGIVFGLKNITGVERPCVPCEGEITKCNPYCLADNSFPSGHSALIFAVFSSLYITAEKKWLTPFFILPFLVSLSRYFLVVHHIMDIVFGTIIGVLIPIIVSEIYEKKF